MKTKNGKRILTALFGLTLGLFLLLYLLLPKEEFSENEKRFLARPPEASAGALLSGSFSEAAESWAADHMPGRSFFVGLNAYYELFSGRQAMNDIVRGRSGRLYEAPVRCDKTVVLRNLTAINDFADAVGRNVDLMLVPSAGFVLRDDIPFPSDPYEDGQIAEAAEAAAGERVSFLLLSEFFKEDANPESLYYRTDHHWTSRGARKAAAFYLQVKNRDFLPESAWTVTEVSGFCGSTWSRAALWLTPAEKLELWDSGTAFTVSNRDQPETEHEGLFYPEHLEESDKYPVFLDGNHSLVRIRNHSPEASGKILVIRDSFASCFGCFLAEAYEETVLVDLRYYRLPVSDLLKEEHFDEVLILYSVNHFMEDANIIRLE